MKRFCFYMACAILFSPFLGSAKKPPGSAIVDNSIFIPSRFVTGFITCPQPDSARLGLNKSLPLLADIEDTSSLLYRVIQKKTLLNSHSSFEDYQFVVNGLGTLYYTTAFRLFYKGQSDQVYKYREYKTNGTLIRELLLIDPAARLVEEATYYKNGIIMGRAQYRIKDTSAKALKDWFRTPLLKEGKKLSYYSNGKVKSVYQYENNKLNDTAIVYNRLGEMLYREVWKEDSIVLRIANKDLSKPGEKVPGKATPDPRRKAFLVGVDKHRYTDKESNKVVDYSIMEYPDLAGCKNDVKILAKVLREDRQFPSGNITALTDDEATKEKLVAALNTFIADLKTGDIVFFHFSGSGNIASVMLPDGTKSEEFAFVCRDINMARYIKNHDGVLRKSELDVFFDRVKKKIGRDGQMIVSLDACEVGAMGNNARKDTTRKADTTLAFRGESGNLLFNFIKKNDAGIALYTAVTGTEVSFETTGDDGKAYGVYSYALADALQNPATSNTRELFDEVVGLVEERSGKQNPGYFANFDFPLFETDEKSADPSHVSLPDVRLSGNAFVLSVGIGQYPLSTSSAKLQFNNCVNDATSYASFFQTQFREIGEGKKLNSYLLTDSAATYKNIMAAINEIIFNSKPDDYFVLNFSGYCKQLTDSTGKRVTYFVPYGLNNISDTSEIKTKGKGIPLSQLKDLLQLIPANNQLFITEAGSTTAFQKEFIQALIESSPTIAALTNKNRVFLVPKSSGMDKFYCKNTPVEHGPLNYYITNLTPELNLFGVFQTGLYADAVKYAINKTEVECDYFKSGYFDIFFERDYISDMQYFMPQEIMQSRGFKVNTEARAAMAVGDSRRYALVVGTDKYDGKPDWNDLKNPVLDAKDIAAELESGFGYKVKLLIDKPIDSIYAHISWLSQVLKKNDQLIIYIAGHGDFDSALLDDGFIVCRDSRPINKDPYRNSYIQYSKFSRMVNRLPANQILMMLDVCFGGTFDERVARNQGRERTTDYDNLSNNSFFAEKLKKKTRLYLTSGGKDVVPDGFDKKHSPFALLLLQVLQGRGGVSKLLTAKNLHQRVERLASGPLLGSFGDDEVGSEFILLGN